MTNISDDKDTGASGTGPGRFRPWMGAALVFACSLSLRLSYLAWIGDGPYFDARLMKGSDCYAYFFWAQDIAGGDLVGKGTFYQSPLYPYFLGFLFSISGGPGLYFARAVQLVLGALTCLMTFELARRIHGLGAGVVSGLMLAFYGPLIFFEGHFLRTGLITFLNLALIFSLYEAWRKPGARRGFFSGLLFGLALLAKPNAAVMLPALVWIVFARRPEMDENENELDSEHMESEKEVGESDSPALKKSIFSSRSRSALGMALGLVMVFGPLAYRNHKAEAPLFSMTRRGALEFIAGNAPDSPPDAWAPDSMVFDLLLKSDRKLGKAALEIMSLYRDDPSGFVKKQLYKTAAFFAGNEAPNNLNYHVEKKLVPFFQFAPVSWPILIGPALAGAWLMRRNVKRWSILYYYLFSYSAATIAFYVLGRFRLPLVPCLCIFAGAGLIETVRAAKEGRRVYACIIVFFIISISAASFWASGEKIRIIDYNNVVRQYLLAKKPEKARAFIEEGRRVAREKANAKGDAGSTLDYAWLLFHSGADIALIENEINRARLLPGAEDIPGELDALSERLEKRKTHKDPRPGGMRILTE